MCRRLFRVGEVETLATGLLDPSNHWGYYLVSWDFLLGHQVPFVSSATSGEHLNKFTTTGVIVCEVSLMRVFFYCMFIEFPARPPGSICHW